MHRKDHQGFYQLFQSIDDHTNETIDVISFEKTLGKGIYYLGLWTNQWLYCNSTARN